MTGREAITVCKYIAKELALGHPKLTMEVMKAAKLDSSIGEDGPLTKVRGAAEVPDTVMTDLLMKMKGAHVSEGEVGGVGGDELAGLERLDEDGLTRGDHARESDVAPRGKVPAYVLNTPR